MDIDDPIFRLEPPSDHVPGELDANEPPGDSLTEDERRPRQQKHLPLRFRDQQPEAPAPAPPPPPPPSVPAASSTNPSAQTFSTEPELVRTERNAFDIYRVYIGRPTHNPDEDWTIEDMSDIRGDAEGEGDDAEEEDSDLDDEEQELPWYYPFPSAFACRLTHWTFNGSNEKSLPQVQELIDNILKAPDFDIESLEELSISTEATRLDQPVRAAEDDEGAEEEEDNAAENVDPTTDNDVGWKTVNVSFPIPPCDRKVRKDEDLPQYTVSDVYVRKIIPIMVEAFQSSKFKDLHTTPFEEHYQPDPDGPSQRIYSEPYNSNKWIKYVKKLYKKRPAGDEHEIVLVDIKLSSDATKLAQFGDASIWPVYFQLGNQSKYARSQPSKHAAYHLAYLPKVCVL